MFMKIGLVIIAGLALACMGLGFLLKASYKANGILEANVAVAEQALVEERETLAAVQAHAEQQAREIAALAADEAEAATQKDKAIAELNSFRNKLGRAATGRPSLVGRLATRASRNVMFDFYTASGGQPASGTDGVPPAPAVPDPPE